MTTAQVPNAQAGLGPSHMDKLEMVDIQQSREFIRKRERKDRSRNSGQTITSLPRIQIYMRKDEARMFCLGVSYGTYRWDQKW